MSDLKVRGYPGMLLDKVGNINIITYLIDSLENFSRGGSISLSTSHTVMRGND